LKVGYTCPQKNIGYGSAHNTAINKMINNTQYHLVLNPDIYFTNMTLEKIYEFAEKNREVGLIMPKVLYPDGSIQYLCKLLPNPFDFMCRRFLPILPNFFKQRNELYEMRFADYDKIMEVPFLSGCFMFIRNEVFKKVGVFDEQFFMYLEDVDLCRRIEKYFKIVYYPAVIVYHECERGSTKDFRLLRHHLASSIKYFNKWGWIFDKTRTQINMKTLKQLGLIKV
jgi:GT2 family glycosyltransferase